MNDSSKIADRLMRKVLRLSYAIVTEMLRFHDSLKNHTKPSRLRNRTYQPIHYVPYSFDYSAAQADKLQNSSMPLE